MTTPRQTIARPRSRPGPSRTALAGLALILSGGAVGCSTMTPFGPISTSTAAGGPSYLGGRASQVFPASETIVADARAVLEDLNVRAIGERTESGTIVLEGRTSAGAKAHVRLQPEAQGRRMHVFVRFGTLGDEALSRGFLEGLAAKANGPAPEDDLREVEAPRSRAASRSDDAARADRAPAQDRGDSIMQRRLEGRGQTELPF